MRRLLPLLLAATLVLSLAACRTATPGYAPDTDKTRVETPETPNAPDAAADAPTAPGGTGHAPASLVSAAYTPLPELGEAEIREDGGYTVYRRGGVDIPVPTYYAYNELVIETPSERSGYYPHWQSLISFSEKASVEAGARLHPGEDWGDGWICDVVQMDQVGFERYLMDEGSGLRLVARGDDGLYYMLAHPTDVRFIHDKYNEGTDGSSEWSGEVDGDYRNETGMWEQLNEWGGDRLAYDLLLFNRSLGAYDARELYQAEYLYGGEHVRIGYYPTGPEWNPIYLILSQPARQGEGGVWCVERVLHEYTGYAQTHNFFAFPVEMGVDRSAGEYYAKLQAECDAGEHPELLAPMGAAVAFMRSEARRRHARGDAPVTEADLVIVEEGTAAK